MTSNTGDASSPRGRGREREDDRKLDAEVDELMRRIESQTGSMYAIHAGDAEEFDPGNLHPDELGEDDAMAESLAHGMSIDEMPDGPDDFEAVTAASEQEPSGKHGHAQKAEVGGGAGGDGTAKDGSGRHTGLKVALVIVIILLLAIVGGIGYLVFRGGTADVTTARPDTEGLVASSSQSGEADFAEVDPAKVPALARVFGLKLADAEEQLGSRFQVEGKPEKTSDSRVKALRQMAEGVYLDESGNKLASVGLGLDKAGEVVYAYVLYNLDDIGVADTSFAELVEDEVVGRSILRSLGAGEVDLGTPKLSPENAERNQARYKGKVDAESTTSAAGVAASEDGAAAPKTWELSETYTYASSSTATARTLIAELY